MRQLWRAALEAGLPHVLASPRDGGRLDLVVRRPSAGSREVGDAGILDARVGLVGDNWLARGSRHSPDGSALPDKQVTVMNSRVAELVAGGKERMPLAGDQLFVDFDLSRENLPAGSLLAVGSSVIEVSAAPHLGCKKFVDRFGADAMAFVNSPAARQLRLRGVNTRVFTPGRIAVGDVVRRLTDVETAGVLLRAMRREDLPLLAGWLGRPHVRRWWIDEPTELDAAEAKYGPSLDGLEPSEHFIIEQGRRPVGMIQRYRIDDYPDWQKALPADVDIGVAAGIDYLVGEPDAVGRGIGTVAIASMTQQVFAWWPDVTTVAVAVQQDNVASWRALERAGYTRVWSGRLDSDDPSDAGPAHLYCRRRS